MRIPNLNKNRVIALRNDDGKWSWFIKYHWGGTEYYHTNSNGEGLWINDIQTIGTCQFSLKGYSMGGARGLINRKFNQ